MLQSNSVPVGEASQQTQLMCKLVKGMLRAYRFQFSAKDAAKHDIFLLVTIFLPKSPEDRLAMGVDTICLEVCLPGQIKVPQKL